MRELRTLLTKYSSEKLATMAVFHLTEDGQVNIVQAPKELVDEIREAQIEGLHVKWNSGILRLEVD